MSLIPSFTGNQMLIAAVLIGILLGGGLVGAMAYSNMLPGIRTGFALDPGTPEESPTVDPEGGLDNLIEEHDASINERADELYDQGSDILDNTNDISNQISTGFDKVLDTFSPQLNGIEGLLGDVNGKLDQYDDILLGHQNDMLIGHQTISERLDNLDTSVGNAVNQIDNINQELGELSNIIQSLNEIKNTLNDMMKKLNEILDELRGISFKVDDILGYLSQMSTLLANMDKKIQKNVDIAINNRDLDSLDPVKKMVMLTSLQGDGVVENTRVTKAMLLGQPDIPVTVTPTDNPGIFNIDVDTTGLQPGVYQLYVEVEIDYPLPDGSTQTFKGVEIYEVYVW